MHLSLDTSEAFDLLQQFTKLTPRSVVVLCINITQTSLKFLHIIILHQLITFLNQNLNLLFVKVTTIWVQVRHAQLVSHGLETGPFGHNQSFSTNILQRQTTPEHIFGSRVRLGLYVVKALSLVA